ncbi:hypothetical protein [Williamsia sp. 1138]|uniref:hypothetical protein n=1 Tax=Williamsia sp. 1138 TaxID=1903117 RepID=UPI001AEFDE84|nr:hypothetical protein [Williamsia sp. 1138]
MDLKLERIAAWAGLVFMVAFGLSFCLIAGLIPPLSPTSSAQEIRQHLINDKIRMRFGIAVMMLASPLAFGFIVAITLRLRQIEGRLGVLSLCQFAAGIVFPIGFMFPAMILGVATYRPESRPPELTLMLNDVFWMIFVGIVGTLVVQAVCVALGVLIDRGPHPVLPRWVGYFNLWCAVLFVPGGSIVLFNDGPLAWNGAFAFWVPLVVFGTWMVLMPVMMLRSINEQNTRERHDSGTLDGCPRSESPEMRHPVAT